MPAWRGLASPTVGRRAFGRYRGQSGGLERFIVEKRICLGIGCLGLAIIAIPPVICIRLHLSEYLECDACKLVCLSDHGRRGLNENVLSSETGGLQRNVGIHDPAMSGFQVRLVLHQ